MQYWFDVAGIEMFSHFTGNVRAPGGGHIPRYYVDFLLSDI